ncbi:MAG: type II toxin-antitoxin system PemK/MazF family toxin [Salinibacter sp.]
MNFSSTNGREQRGNRPAFVLSDIRFNEGPSGLIISIPLTATNRPEIPTHIEGTPNQGASSSVHLSMQFRATSKHRLRQRVGRVRDPEVVHTVENRVRLRLDP